MATRLPPPKRVKLDNGVPVLAPESPPKAAAPNVVVQFVSEDDGTPLAPAVNIPADFGRDGLETMINKLASKVFSIFSPSFGLSDMLWVRTMSQLHTHFTSMRQVQKTLKQRPEYSYLTL
jgi:hypothetical protein